ncbi:hypothetical protein F4780DRAFT_369590 [Xylariomycetidae sp. FL0641]|nr:hypothetical protein F4780DRAFT_369590 [Xylariomycetidae sp. FL0641]
MDSKPLTITGDHDAGTSTLVGNLIRVCGLGLSDLDELERNGIRDPVALVSYYQQKGVPPSFYAPSGQLRIQNHGPAGAVLWVVDATTPDAGRASKDKLVSALSDGTVRSKEKLVIVVNKMDLVQWSEEKFRCIADTFSSLGAGFGKYGMPYDPFGIPSSRGPRTYLVPASGVNGGNLLDRPAEARWLEVGEAGRNGASITIARDPLLHLL